MKLDYEIVDRPSEAVVKLRFKGRFQQREVNWNGTIMSLNNYCALHPDFIPDYGERTALMNVTEPDSLQPSITIALPYDRIGEAEIRKTILMVRNYKLLRKGLHQWSA